MGRLDGKVAVVTGGANGVGLACCERFAQEGARVVIGDILSEPGAAAAAAVERGGGKAVFVQFDAANAEDSDKLMQAAIDSFGGLDILIASHGIPTADYRSGDIEAGRRMLSESSPDQVDLSTHITDLPVEEWDKVIEVNLTGTLFAIQAAARRMRDAGRGGSIVTFSAIGAKAPGLASVTYSVAKAGVWMLTKSAAVALAPVGIRVNAIGPGAIETNMTALVDELPELKAILLARTPMGRFGKPSEVANAALFLASDESSYFTGEILHPDGGFYTE